MRAPKIDSGVCGLAAIALRCFKFQKDQKEGRGGDNFRICKN